MTQFKKYRLRELCTKIGSGATPRGGDASYKSHGISLIRSQNILDFTFSNDGLAYIDDYQAKELDNVEIQERDVLLNITGDSVARVCQVLSGILPARVNQHVAILRANKEILNPEYLKYSLLSKKNKENFLSLASTGATRKALTKGMIEDFEIDIPDEDGTDTQTRIASILSSLDDKIELNRRTNHTLEQIAQTLFKKYFVDDIDPENLPEGWKYETLRKHIKIKNGFAFKGIDFIENWFLVFFIFIVFGGFFFLDSVCFVCFLVVVFAKGYQVKKNDLLVTMTGNRLDGSPETWVGKIALFHKDGEYLLNQRVSIMNVLNDDVMSRYFLCQLLTTEEMQYYYASHATSSGGQANISPDLIYDTEVLVPPQNVMKLFNSVTKELYDKMFANETEIESLRKIRDSLLPKLMSGEIEVNAAEKELVN